MQDGIVGRQMEMLSKGNAGYKTAADVDSATRASRRKARVCWGFFCIVRKIDPSTLLNIIQQF